ncbi:AAA family ATPase [Streptomyces sp. AcE210]|uniref:AAA family ATPase n=1 Tax=Streptomyces sp. AcE210 TaxID=2292703 RepID=UPI000E304E92|nr:AAA family ATPase [Streptomyces sp. AcE210]RFC70627.1 ATP-binding protein [Streptomyces sp. AcE210]
MSTPRVHLVIGPAGSGKSSVARLIAERTAAVYLDKDTVCTRLTEALLAAAGTDPSERDHNPYYQSVVMDLEYATLLDLAQDNLRLGNSVVLDAPFGRYFADPGYLESLADRPGWPRNVEYVVVRVRVDKETAHARVRARGHARDASKLADWDAFWDKASTAECRWTGARIVEFDNGGHGIDADAVGRELNGPV